HFVPPGTEALTEVIHYGKNSLPAFNIFEKRFAKPKDEAKKDSLLGYNQQNLIWAIGPGYFEVHKAKKDGEIDIDYTKIPVEKVGTWPGITTNKVKLGRFVYEGMIDVMRKVSTHVSIGRATKGGKNMDAWFVLCREEKE
ncbi:MAG TPA: hypothetical protein VF407_01870, partial [Polyangiaceae bacterium]